MKPSKKNEDLRIFTQLLITSIHTQHQLLLSIATSMHMGIAKQQIPNALTLLSDSVVGLKLTTQGCNAAGVYRQNQRLYEALSLEMALAALVREELKKMSFLRDDTLISRQQQDLDRCVTDFLLIIKAY